MKKKIDPSPLMSPPARGGAVRAGGRSALAQLVADSPRLAAQRRLGEAANRSGKPKLAPHGPGATAHQELALLNAALAEEEERKRRP